MPCDAGDAAGNAGDQVDGGECPVAIQRFCERAKVPQAPHVERDMNHANVQKHAGEQSPPLAAQRKRTPVGSPMHKLLGSGTGDGNSGERHPQKNGSVDSHEGVRDQRLICRALRPGHGHYGLYSVVGKLTALCGFVLDAPLADLFPERKRRKIATALYTIRHC